ncbi:MAG: hypothetical protein AB7L84_09105 [Acidimicrobiia bacterium]
MQLRGIEDLKAGRLTSWPWWADGLLALAVGLGIFLSSVRRLDDSTEWGLVGHWVLAVAAGAAMVAWGWAAIVKLRERPTAR